MGLVRQSSARRPRRSPTPSDALQGHAVRRVADHYGTDEDGAGFALMTLHRAICRLNYPDLLAARQSELAAS